MSWIPWIPMIIISRTCRNWGLSNFLSYCPSIIQCIEDWSHSLETYVSLVHFTGVSSLMDGFLEAFIVKWKLQFVWFALKAIQSHFLCTASCWFGREPFIQLPSIHTMHITPKYTFSMIRYPRNTVCHVLLLIFTLLCVSDVTAIIFVVACSSYNLVLREDPSQVSCFFFGIFIVVSSVASDS